MTSALEKKNYVEYINDDLYVEYTVEELPTSRAAYQKAGRKTAKVKSGSTVLWTVTVTGEFSYTGSTSICTKSTVSTTCSAKSWKITSKSASKSGASSTAKATGKHYQYNVVIGSRTQSVVLTCGSDGTLY